MLNKFYQQQQVIMTLLGYYDGKCDGVWGPKCFEAKRLWETTDAYEPAVPTNGLPFSGRGKLPKGMSWGHKGLSIVWSGWDEEKAAEILKDKGELLTCSLVRAHVFQECAAIHAVEPEPALNIAPEPVDAQQQVSTLKPFSSTVEPGTDDSDIGTDLGAMGEPGSPLDVDEDEVVLQSSQEQNTTNVSRKQRDWNQVKKQNR